MLVLITPGVFDTLIILKERFLITCIKIIFNNCTIKYYNSNWYNVLGCTLQNWFVVLPQTKI